MIVGIGRTSFSYSCFLEKRAPGSLSRRHSSSWRRTVHDAGFMDMKLLSCHSTTTVIPNEINPISKWFAMSGCFVLVENCLCSFSSGNGVEIVFGGNALYFGSVRILEHRGGHSCVIYILHIMI